MVGPPGRYKRHAYISDPGADSHGVVVLHYLYLDKAQPKQDPDLFCVVKRRASHVTIVTVLARQVADQTPLRGQLRSGISRNKTLYICMP